MRFILLSALLLLAACQSPSVDHDFDPSRDFAGYRSWQWLEPAVQYRPDDPRLKSDITEQRVRQAVASQLDQRGLRPATGGAADLKVQVWLIVDERQQAFTTSHGGYWGDPWHGYWGSPMFNDTRIVQYQVRTLQIDLFDGRDGKLVWRGSTEQTLPARATPAQRNQTIQRNAAEALSTYPPGAGGR
jgi:hypothetical protein